MRVLLTGSSGQLGRALIASKPDNIKLINTSRKNFDLSDPDKCRSLIIDQKPDWLINCAAYTNVDKAEKEKKLAIEINGESLKYLSEQLLKVDCKLIHFSSDYVFDGKKNLPYETIDKTNPINIYGKSKVIGEKYIKEILGDYGKGFIIRTSWLISPFGKNFVTKMIQLMNDNDQIKVINDQYSCPTSCEDLATFCWKLLHYHSAIKDNSVNKKSIYHYCDSGIASWYELAMEVKKYALYYSLIKNPVFIKPIKTLEYQSFANRPKFSLLNCQETVDKFKIERLDWRINLKKIIDSISTKGNSFTN